MYIYTAPGHFLFIDNTTTDKGNGYSAKINYPLCDNELLQYYKYIRPVVRGTVLN